MRIAQAESSLREYLAGRGLVVEAHSVAAVVDAMIDWYEADRADDAAEDDGDMLLLQWGPFDTGQGPVFEYGLTRQLVEAADQEDEGIHQLSVTFRFGTTDATDELQRGSMWCHRPEDASAFRAGIRSEAATSFASSERPSGVVVLFEVAG